jgi:hypothetical protein
MPSARPVDEVNARLAKWHEMGYRIATLREFPISGRLQSDFDMVSTKYRGFYRSQNQLLAYAFSRNPDCDWCVCAADDIDPDPTRKADEIAKECSFHFAGSVSTRHEATFGVMQPTGDRWGADEPWALQNHPYRPAYIDRIAGSPWIGREYARRANMGNGPWWPEYTHMFGDEELWNVARMRRCYQERRDLTHYHDHCRRDGVARTPDFHKETYSSEHWRKYGDLFRERQAVNFPGSEFLPA